MADDLVKGLREEEEGRGKVGVVYELWLMLLLMLLLLGSEEEEMRAYLSVLSLSLLLTEGRGMCIRGVFGIVGGVDDIIVVYVMRK